MLIIRYADGDVRCLRCMTVTVMHDDDADIGEYFDRVAFARIVREHVSKFED